MLMESASPWLYCCYVHFQRIIAASFYLLVCFNAPQGWKNQETFKSHFGRGQGCGSPEEQWGEGEVEGKKGKGKKVEELGEIMRHCFNFCYFATEKGLKGASREKRGSPIEKDEIFAVITGVQGKGVSPLLAL